MYLEGGEKHETSQEKGNAIDVILYVSDNGESIDSSRQC